MNRVRQLLLVYGPEAPLNVYTLFCHLVWSCTASKRHQAPGECCSLCSTCTSKESDLSKFKMAKQVWFVCISEELGISAR